MSVEEVRKASDQFYATLNRALNGGITDDMFDVFSQAGDVTTMHPLGGRQTGWTEVRPSWEMAANSASGGSVVVNDLQITMLGSDAAYTIGTETASASVGGTPLSFSGRCTNVYRRENGTWKLVHHHVDLMPGVAEAFQAAMSQAS
ncbi:MAG: nuclear transport factor 2 family protein [Nitrolancea sp.]